MKNTMKLFASLVLATGLAACSQQAPEEPIAETPTDTADEFAARMHEEYLEYAEEAELANWVYTTYFFNGSSGNNHKSYTNRVRAVRAF